MRDDKPRELTVARSPLYGNCDIKIHWHTQASEPAPSSRLAREGLATQPADLTRIKRSPGCGRRIKI